MKVLTVFTHPGAQSFCHAVLERFDAGLRDAGHVNEILDRRVHADVSGHRARRARVLLRRVVRAVHGVIGGRHSARARTARSDVVWILVSLDWAWSGVAYHAFFFTRINPAAWVFGSIGLRLNSDGACGTHRAIATVVGRPSCSRSSAS